MGVKGVYGKGPVDISRHQELADDAGRKAAKETNRDKRLSLEHLQKDHQAIVDNEKARRAQESKK